MNININNIELQLLRRFISLLPLLSFANETCGLIREHTMDLSSVANLIGLSKQSKLNYLQSETFLFISSLQTLLAILYSENLEEM